MYPRLCALQHRPEILKWDLSRSDGRSGRVGTAAEPALSEVEGAVYRAEARSPTRETKIRK